MLPLLYLHGLSSSDFGPALEQFLGSDAGLSRGHDHPAHDAVARRGAGVQRPIAGRHRTTSTCWVDGIHLKVRLEQDKVCLLVIIGVRADGRKELVALADGFRESAESWADLLRDCQAARHAGPGAGGR